MSAVLTQRLVLGGGRPSTDRDRITSNKDRLCEYLGGVAACALSVRQHVGTTRSSTQPLETVDGGLLKLMTRISEQSLSEAGNKWTAEHHPASPVSLSASDSRGPHDRGSSVRLYDAGNPGESTVRLNQSTTSLRQYVATERKWNDLPGTIPAQQRRLARGVDVFL